MITAQILLRSILAKQAKSKLGPVKRVRVQTPGSITSFHRASSEGRQFLTPDERGQLQRDQFLASAGAAWAAESADAQTEIDDNKLDLQHLPQTHSSSVRQKSKRKAEDVSLALVSKRRKMLPHGLIDNHQFSWQRRSTSRSSSPTVANHAGPSNLDHAPGKRQGSTVPHAASEGDDFHMQTDSESLEEDSVVDEDEVEFGRILRLGESVTCHTSSILDLTTEMRKTMLKTARSPIRTGMLIMGPFRLVKINCKTIMFLTMHQQT